MAERFDVVIVGAGSAGCVLANRLSEDPAARVLLLEAGGSDAHPLLAVPIAWTTAMQTPQLGWGYATEPEAGADDRVVPTPRGRVLGGTSSINGMMYVRGQAQDYDSWAQMGLKGWSYAEVLPYFRRSEASWRGDGPYHGASGPLSVVPQPRDPALTPRFLAAAEALGYRANPDANGEVQEGFGVPDFTIARGRRASTARAFLAPALRRPNLTVRSQAQVSRVLIEAGRAGGVEYRRDGRTEQALAGEVILSAGAFGSPQLLMLSGIGPADHLASVGVKPRRDLPGVGRNLQDHPLVLAIHQAAGAYAFHDELRLDRLARLALQWALFGSGALAHMPMPVQGFVRIMPGQTTPDCQLQVSSVSMAARPWFPGWRSSPGHHFTTGALQLRPHGRGEVQLRSDDPAAAPRIRLNLFQHEADKAFARGMFAFIRELFATAPASGLVAAELLPGPQARTQDEIDAHIRATIQTGMHPSCTCAMGQDQAAVVDHELRVRGVEGLRVADCSVMPNIVSGNTNAPAIMIGEKAADLVLGRTPPAPAELSSRHEVPVP